MHFNTTDDKSEVDVGRLAVYRIETLIDVFFIYPKAQTVRPFLVFVNPEMPDNWSVEYIYITKIQQPMVSA